MTDGNSADLSDWTDSPSFEEERVTSRGGSDDTHTIVYWDQTNEIGYDTFKTTSSEMPDLVTQGSDTIVYEVKNTEGTKGEDTGSDQVNDGVTQLIGYWKDYVDGGVEYLVDGEPTDVDTFVLATEKAPCGRLYVREGNNDVLRTGSGGGRQQSVQYNHLPNNEFNATERAIRLMWRFVEYQHQDQDVETGIGALLSTRLGIHSLKLQRFVDLQGVFRYGVEHPSPSTDPLVDVVGVEILVVAVGIDSRCRNTVIES